MKSRMAVVAAVAMGLVGAFVFSGGDAVADNTSAVATCTMATVPAMGDNEYVGSSKCKMCHKAQFDSWSETTHAKAFDVLKPGECADAKKAHNLDPEKDYTTDEACVGCHVTGFGKAGGYAVTSDEKEAKKMAKLEGVGCEMCHGAGSGYMDLKKEIKKEKRNYKFEELEAAGMMKVDAATCQNCHNEKSPTAPEGGFDFDKAKEDAKAIHVHEKLELREG